VLTIIGFIVASIILKPVLRNNYRYGQIRKVMTDEQIEFLMRGGK
jgi:hypothetical protein